MRVRYRRKTSSSAITIDTALSNKQLLGAALGDPETWQTWVAVLKATFGLPLDEDQQSVFASVAGNRPPPTQRVRELWAVCGRRGGKSRMAAALSVYLALFQKYPLTPGEIGMVLVLAASQEQARVVFNYALAFLKSSPVLRKEVIDNTRSEIRLRNGLVISIHANSFRTVRGRTLCACVFDEIAFWRDETVPDAEVYSAVLPSLATTNGLLVGISSPYRKVGLLHSKHRTNFGTDSNDIP
jgi:phage terminase large subunit-like protein